ncbi:unnamed protein product [Caenorhabditis angaria]|uniref:Vacuolar protein sorting-associated protein 16 homolog n=1 Tax=Caenorhabditis angaria TaxID=860376 RepID=A0A9P1N2F3_9PELO|nr:unnamed protein product [Caenorhabditis angaria]
MKPDLHLANEQSLWIDVANIQLCFTKQYENISSLNLKNVVHFSACSFSGPIALAFSQSSSSWIVSIRTCSGRILKQNLAVPDAFSIEWTRGHCLLVLNRRGHAAVYSSLGEQISDIHFSNHIREVQSSRMFATSRGDSGIAIIDDECRVFVVNSVSEPIVWNINSPVKEELTAWSAFQPHSQLTHVLLIFGSQFYMGQQGEQMTIQPQAASWAENAKYIQCVIDDARSRIALLTDTSIIQIVSIDLDTLFTNLRLPSHHNLSNCFDFGWVKTSVLFAQISPSLTLFINVKSTSLEREMASVYEKHTGNCRIGVENDGIRIFENNQVEFATVASKEQKTVLGIASSDDGALLHEAAKYLDGPLGHQSFEYAQQVQDMLKAIDDCIIAACDSWQPELQKSLLKAARFGMAFSSTTYDTSKLMKAIREIRVLNELHSSRTGVPLTHRQLRAIGETCLINRLVDMGSYSIAIRIAQWLGGEQSENVDRVLLEWVRRAINKAAKSEQRFDKRAIEALEEKISAKLLLFPHVSIADAAKRAIEANLPQLARLFIRRETDDSNHVAILLQLDDVPAALERAAAAQRPQLIHQVVRHLMSSQRRADYELAIRKIPLAQCLYQDLVRQEGEQGRGVSSRQMLALLEQASDFERQTLFHFDVAEVERNPSERLKCTASSQRCCKKYGRQSD